MGLLDTIKGAISGSKSQGSTKKPNMDAQLVPQSQGMERLDEINNQIKDAYISSGGTGYVGPQDLTGFAQQVASGSAPAAPSKLGVGLASKGGSSQLVQSEGAAADAENPFGTMMPSIMPADASDTRLSTKGLEAKMGEAAIDKKAHGQYMEYFNDHQANPMHYDDSTFDMDYMTANNGEDLVDNGTNSYLNRSSHFITGEEAKRQAKYFDNQEMLDALDAVDDNAILSKRSLRSLGYVPFVDDPASPSYVGSKLSQELSNLGEASEEAWNKISNLRNENTDWKVKLFDRVFSGKEMDEAIIAAKNDGVGFYDEDKNWCSLFDRNGIPIQFYPGDAQQRDDGVWMVPASDGNVYAIDAAKCNDDASAEGILSGYPPQWKPAIVKDSTGEEYEIPFEMWKDVTKNPEIAEIITSATMPNASNEEKLAAASELYDQMGSATDYGILNVNAPDYKSGDMLSEYWLPSLVNGTLSSAAYFNPYTLTERAALAGGLSASGLTTTSQDRIDIGEGEDRGKGDNYLLSYKPSGNQLANETMSVIAPYAESRLGSLGNIGGKGFIEGAASKLVSKIPGLNRTMLGKEVIPAAIGEGMEEVLTDPLYSLQENGSGAYANQAMDQDGVMMFDDYGRPVFESTSAGERIKNYLAEQPNNFAMGAVLGGGMNGGGMIATRQGREQIRQNKADNDFFNQHVKGVGGSFSRDQVSSLRERANAANRLAGLSGMQDQRIPMTMSEFEEMLSRMNSVDDEIEDYEPGSASKRDKR